MFQVIGSKGVTGMATAEVEKVSTHSTPQALTATHVDRLRLRASPPLPIAHCVCCSLCASAAELAR